jgi:hypothetical protein
MEREIFCDYWQPSARATAASCTVRAEGSRVKYFLGTLETMLRERPPLGCRRSEDVRGATTIAHTPITIGDPQWTWLAGAVQIAQFVTITPKPTPGGPESVEESR